MKITNDGVTIEWLSRLKEGAKYQISWMPVVTRLYLHSGRYRWDFVVEEMGEGQIIFCEDFYQMTIIRIFAFIGLNQRCQTLFLINVTNLRGKHSSKLTQ